MKKYLILIVFKLIIFACSKKEVKDEQPIVIEEIKENVSEVEEVPELIFTVQIAALKKENSKFNNIDSVQVFQEEGLVKYRLGKILTYKEAREYRASLLNKYSDAFVQALKNEKPINIKEALNN
jgi:hypothetical protein